MNSTFAINGVNRQLTYLIKVIADNLEHTDKAYKENRIDEDDIQEWQDLLYRIKSVISGELDDIMEQRRNRVE